MIAIVVVTGTLTFGASLRHARLASGTLRLELGRRDPDGWRRRQHLVAGRARRAGSRPRRRGVGGGQLRFAADRRPDRADPGRSTRRFRRPPDPDRAQFAGGRPDRVGRDQPRPTPQAGRRQRRSKLRTVATDAAADRRNRDDARYRSRRPTPSLDGNGRVGLIPTSSLRGPQQRPRRRQHRVRAECDLRADAPRNERDCLTRDTASPGGGESRREGCSRRQGRKRLGRLRPTPGRDRRITGRWARLRRCSAARSPSPQSPRSR